MCIRLYALQPFRHYTYPHENKEVTAVNVSWGANVYVECVPAEKNHVVRPVFSSLFVAAG